MALNQGKHIIEVIDGKRCTLVESGISRNRKEFLQTILEFNGYEVKTAVDEEGTWKIGVTDLVFHAVVDIYKRSLLSPNGHRITPAYWLQLTDHQSEAEVNYWTQK
ncbi:MAG: hypothetical protein D4R64_02840 [Porphyromonadaceae bacterium]|nr:MAG: hypothetical protein D4R64_02840 [Porphyromonadaceae bacterium]